MDNLMPGEWEAQNPVFIGAKNKNRLAEALRKQSAMPQGQMVGDRFVAPSITQFLASGFNQYRANELENEANQAMQEQYANRQRMMQDASARYAEALNPRQTDAGMVQPTPEEIMRAQMQYAQSVQDPRLLMQAGDSTAQYGIAQQQREDQQAFQRQQAEENRAQRMQELQMRMLDQQASRAEQAQARKELAQMNIDARLEMFNLAQANRPEKMVVVMDDSGMPVSMPQSQAAGMTLYNPSAAKTLKDKKTMQTGKNEVGEIVSQLKNSYDTLKGGGGIASETSGGLTNIGAMLSNTPIGQTVARASGSELQTARDTITQTRPLLLAAIKNATGMSAQQMNSNVEMQMYLKAATDPALGYEANMNALRNLDKMYGLGMNFKDSGKLKKYNPKTGRIE